MIGQVVTFKAISNKQNNGCDSVFSIPGQFIYFPVTKNEDYYNSIADNVANKRQLFHIDCK